MNPVIVASAVAWRAWLAEHGTAHREAWLVVARKGATGVSYQEAVEQALCFGWIDSQARRRDADSTYLRFSPRRPGSRWSQPNRDRVARLVEHGLMTPAGYAAIDEAHRRGTW